MPTPAAPDSPLVTVVVPAWNAAATLAETLASVAAQTYRPLEILIVDDGSTDETHAIAEAFCATEPRARLIAKENGGVASARNRGMAEAKGDWVAPVDADDLWHPFKIERQVEAARAAPTPPGFVYCWFRVIDADGRIIGAGERWRVEGAALNRLVYRNVVGNGSGLLLSRAAALEAGGYDQSLRARGAEGCEDVSLQLQVARRHAIALVPEYLVGYRYQPGGMSRSSARMVRSLELALERLRADGAAVPAETMGRTLGIRSLGLAEAGALAGDWPGCFRHLWRALRLDPTRTALHLLYRACRLATRLVRGRRMAPAHMRFADADPREEMRFDPDELRGFARLLERLEHNRMARLEALERPPRTIG